MGAGAAAFEELMPGWKEEMGARGAGSFDASADVLSRLSAGWLPRTPSGIATYACSRTFLENVLRRGLVTKSTIYVKEGQKVLGLLGGPLGDRVIGVRTVARHAADQSTLLADLVVDASGAGSMLPRWICHLPNGIGSQLQKTVVESRMQYVSRWFHVESADAPDWHCLSIAPAQDAGLRAAMMLRAEDDRWGIVLLAPAGEPVPAGDMAFLDFTSSLGGGELRRALGRARPISPIHRHAQTPSRMLHYDRLTAWPAGLVALGDSVCRLDPYFGLGMTAAARGAVLLRKCLDRQGTSFSPLDFQKNLAQLNLEPWRLATGRELDGRPLTGRAHLYHLSNLAPLSPDVAHAVLAVQHLLRPIETLREVPV
jgi:2-polyprenyl-6-methoxyphenol hydroxylase-like FAD-dependent oxidoreductase